MNNQLPPQLPNQTPPQVPQQPQYQQPQYAQPQYQQPQYKPQYNYNNGGYPPKKKMSTGVKVLIGIVAFFFIATVIGVIFGDQNAVNNDNDVTKKWNDIGITDSLRLVNGYFSADSMKTFNDFNKRFPELQEMLMKHTHTPKEIKGTPVQDLIKHNSNRANMMMDDSIVRYRNQFTENMQNKLVQENIKLKASNNGRNLLFVGSLFGNPAATQKFHQDMRFRFVELGYRRVGYKVSDSSGEVFNESFDFGQK